MVTGSFEEVANRFCAALSSIADAMMPTGNWRAVLDRILRSLVDNLGYKAASARRLDAEHRTLVLCGAVGLSEAYLDKGSIELDKSGIDREVLSGMVIDISDAACDPRLQYPEAAAQEGIGSILAAPLALRDRSIGVLRVYSGEPRTADAIEKKFLQSVAKLAARALVMSHRIELLHNLARQVNSSLDPQVVLSEMLQNTVDELNFKGGIVRLLDRAGERLELVAATGVTQAYLNKGPVSVGQSAMDRSVLQGNAVTIYDVMAEPGYQYPEEALKEGIRSVQSIPLATMDPGSGQARIFGVLRIYSAQPHRFGEDEIAFLQSIANLGAVALENARLHQQLMQRVDAQKLDEEGWYRIEES
jgi:signal transduction protein with GAF and PtsI domain